MKLKLFVTIACIATSFSQFIYARESVTISPLLSSYYSIKDALVSGNAGAAAASAADFIKEANAADQQTLPAANRAALLKNAAKIAGSKDLKQQRVSFALFSTDMATFAKTGKLSSAPVYQQYCPMKKASWLSSSSTIKNPYYGSAMLTCGEVTDTIQ